MYTCEIQNFIEKLLTGPPYEAQAQVFTYDRITLAIYIVHTFGESFCTAATSYQQTERQDKV